MKQFLKTLADFFVNFNGDGDAKLFLGIGLVIFSCFYIAMIERADVVGFLAISGVGTGLLGLGVVQDKVNAKIPTPPSNPGAGLPGS